MCRARRERLWMKDSYCCWCGVETILHADLHHPQLATIEHVFSRNHPLREDFVNNRKASMLTISCQRCNRVREKIEQQMVMPNKKVKQHLYQFPPLIKLFFFMNLSFLEHFDLEIGFNQFRK